MSEHSYRFRATYTAALIGLLAASYSVSVLAGVVPSRVDCSAPSYWSIDAVGRLGRVPVDMVSFAWFAIVAGMHVAAPILPPRPRRKFFDLLFWLAVGAIALLFPVGRMLLQAREHSGCGPCVVMFGAVAALFVLAGSARGDVLHVPEGGYRRVCLTLLAGLLATLPFGLVGLRKASEPSKPSLPRSEGELVAWVRTQPRLPGASGEGGRLVSIVEFVDYQCPYSRQSFQSHGSTIEGLGAANPGRIDILYRDYPLDPQCNPSVKAKIHEAACRAAVAVKIASATGRDRELRARLFSEARLSPEKLERAIQDFGLTAETDARYSQALEAVKSDIALAERLGVKGTPSLFVNGLRMPAGIDPETLTRVITYELKAR